VCAQGDYGGGCGSEGIYIPPTPTPTTTPTTTPTLTPTNTPTVTPTNTQIPVYKPRPTSTATLTPTPSPVPLPTLSNETYGDIVDSAGDIIDVAENQGMLPFHVPMVAGMAIDGGAQLIKDFNKPYSPLQKVSRAGLVAGEGQVASLVGATFAAPFIVMGAPEGGPIGMIIGAGVGYVAGNAVASIYMNSYNEAYAFPWIQQYIP
jgi:hypothetical protein